MVVVAAVVVVGLTVVVVVVTVVFVFVVVVFAFVVVAFVDVDAAAVELIFTKDEPTVVTFSFSFVLSFGWVPQNRMSQFLSAISFDRTNTFRQTASSFLPKYILCQSVTQVLNYRF